VEARFDQVLQIHQKETIIALSAGMITKPLPLDNEGFPVFESRLCAAYLRRQGLGICQHLL
jgi:hypothetical protein